MDPLQASWLLKACYVLHNHFLDWGLRKLKPSQNRDPTMEADILVEATERFQQENEGIQDDDLPDDPPPRANYGPTHAGVVRRQSYIHRNYGGPAPAKVGGGRDRGCGRGCCRGRGCGRGRGLEDVARWMVVGQGGTDLSAYHVYVQFLTEL